MQKIIVVTWWVYSWLGKWIAGASIWRLLVSAWYTVTMVKMDPYLHVDAGTMNPYSHGEVFVTDDGAETDLDLWHYERFLDSRMTAHNSITSWKIYMDVLTRERKWEFLGQNVQVVPHITDAIKKQVRECGEWYQVVIAEIGWTVWDIESPAFFEAMRQLRRDVGEHNIMYIHLAPIVYIPGSNEEKTKPIQHSVKELRQTWIYPDALIVRAVDPLSDAIKQKLSVMCDIDYDAIIEWLQVQSIYQVPLMFFQQNFHKVIERRLGLPMKQCNLTKWSDRVNQIINPSHQITIGLVWKYTELGDCDISVMEALKHAGAAHSCRVKIVPIHPELLEWDDRESVISQQIKNYDISWILVPGWFGSRGTQGMINAISYARINKIPFLWICYGLQLATIEFARHVCELFGANSTEIDPSCSDPIIDIMESQKQLNHKGWTMRLWSYEAKLGEWTVVSKLYGWLVANERHRHRYEVNSAYHEILQSKWLNLSWLSPDWKLVEFIEISWHPYFVATQAHPELKSTLEHPAPLFLGFVKACLG